MDRNLILELLRELRCEFARSIEIRLAHLPDRRVNQITRARLENQSQICSATQVSPYLCCRPLDMAKGPSLGEPLHIVGDGLHVFPLAWDVFGRNDWVVMSHNRPRTVSDFTTKRRSVVEELGGVISTCTQD
jgi:hypothetical protein